MRIPEATAPLTQFGLPTFSLAEHAWGACGGTARTSSTRRAATARFAAAAICRGNPWEYQGWDRSAGDRVLLCSINLRSNLGAHQGPSRVQNDAGV